MLRVRVYHAAQVWPHARGGAGRRLSAVSVLSVRLGLSALSEMPHLIFTLTVSAACSWVKEGYPVAKDAPDMEAARCPPAPLEEWRRNDGMVRQFEQVRQH